jgi:hypothetical protein
VRPLANMHLPSRLREGNFTTKFSGQHYKSSPSILSLSKGDGEDILVT